MHIRDALRQDVPAIVGLLAQDDLGSQREIADEPLPDGYWSTFEAIDSDANNRLAVAEDDDGNIVATLQLTFLPYLTFQGGWRAQIEAVRVASRHRGQGLGRQMFEWAVAEARIRGCHLIQLTTNKEREDAHRFYESLGFQATHEGMKLYL